MTRPHCLLLALGVAGCTLLGGGAAPVGSGIPPAWHGAPPPPPTNLPLPAARAAALLARATFALENVEPAPGGVMGVKKATAHFPVAGQRLTVKWKEAPSETIDGWNNTPRKELAAGAVQEWFLDQGDYIVPPSAVRCLPLDEYRRLVDPEASPTIAGTQCVLGLLSAWVDDVHTPDPVYDPRRFLTDTAYAYHMADFNLFTFLIQHRDGRAGNFLAANAPRPRRLFAIDNGIAFGGLVYNYFVENWDVIRVPALRRRAVERLRTIRKEHLDSLAVLTELRTDGAGVLRTVRPSAPMAPDDGSWIGEGRMQLGLSRDEIAAVADRLHALLAEVDGGDLPLF